MKQTTREKLEKLRASLMDRGVDAYLIPRADEYLGEFVAPYAERLAYLTGFTGSAGTAVVLQDRAMVMSDGRYTIQLQDQVDPALFAREDSTKYPLKDWLYDQLQPGQVVGFDPRLYSIEAVTALEQRLAVKDILCKPIEDNLIDQIWDDQPSPPVAQAFAFDEKLCGQGRQDKASHLFKALTDLGAQAAILTKPDSVAWLLNIRGADLAYMPVVLSVVLVDALAQKLYWCVQAAKVPAALKEALAPLVTLVEPEALPQALQALSGQSVALDFMSAPHYYAQLVQGLGKAVLDAKDPCAEAKARKTPQERISIEKAHILDGAAIVKTLAWLDRLNAVGTLAEVTEMDVAAKLDEMRRNNQAYRGESFPAITGFAGNGAIVHYRAVPATNKKLAGDNLLLIDSGGQYYDEAQHCAGTTDITRTVALGDPALIAPEAKENFTLVLQGHIALAAASFAEGTTGMQLDALARGPLQHEGRDYAHGTGHGVGCFGDVHEEAAHISPRGKAALQAGMLLSNEPGYYEAGQYGIRTENLVFVCEAAEGNPQTLQFKTVTLAPIDQRLIVTEKLSAGERAWLDSYHVRVYETLAPLLDEEDAAWLKAATAPLA